MTKKINSTDDWLLNFKTVMQNTTTTTQIEYQSTAKRNHDLLIPIQNKIFEDVHEFDDESSRKEHIDYLKKVRDEMIREREKYRKYLDKYNKESKKKKNKKRGVILFFYSVAILSLVIFNRKMIIDNK